jgi:hypothetical protein
MPMHARRGSWSRTSAACWHIGRAIARILGRTGLSGACVMLVFASVTMRAQTAPPSGGGSGHLDLGIGIHTGTLGFGAEVNKLLFSYLGIRAGFNYFSFGFDHSIADVDYSAKLRLQSVPVLVDLYPFARGPLHVTGGVVFNQTQFTGTAVSDSNGTITINHDQYTLSQVGVFKAAIKYPTSGGYVGLGIGTPAFSSRLSGTFDIGAILSKPRVSLTSTGAATNAQLATDLAAQQASTQTSVNKLSAYPVLSTGLMVRF